MVIEVAQYKVRTPIERCAFRCLRRAMKILTNQQPLWFSYHAMPQNLVKYLKSHKIHCVFLSFLNFKEIRTVFPVRTGFCLHMYVCCFVYLFCLWWFYENSMKPHVFILCLSTWKVSEHVLWNYLYPVYMLSWVTVLFCVRYVWTPQFSDHPFVRITYSTWSLLPAVWG